MPQLHDPRVHADNLSVTQEIPTASRTARRIADVCAAMSTVAARGLVCGSTTQWQADWTRNSGGQVLTMGGDLTEPEVEWIDWESSVARVAGGANVGQMTAQLITNGWCPLTVAADPGMTAAQMVAANPLAANGGTGGRIGAGIVAIELVDAQGSVVRVEPSTRPELFWATLGGFGLTGVITSIEVRLRAITSAWMTVESVRADTFEDLIERLREAPDGSTNFGLIDPSGSRSGLARGSVLSGRHARASELPSVRAQAALTYGEAAPGSVRRLGAWIRRGSLARHTLGAKHLASAPSSKRLQPLADFFRSASTGIPSQASEWLNYEVEVPDRALEVVPELISNLQKYDVPIARATIARVSREGSGSLQFTAGWRMSFAVPASDPGTARILDTTDERIVGNGGQVVLSSDERVRPELIPAMTPHLEKWQAVRRQHDPQKRLISDFTRRLNLD